MLIKPNWDNFKAKFTKNPQDNFRCESLLIIEEIVYKGLNKYEIK